MSASPLKLEPVFSASDAARAELSRRIKQHAAKIGFQKVGIVRADALPTEAAHLSEWLARGYHGNMQWIERDPQARTDPRRFFPGTRSVVAVAINYYTPSEHTESPSTGKVSRYAWGDDYHELIGAKLRQLLDWIKEQVPAVDGKVCVDIQPVMDKAWARRAGLGWIGKHTNLITPEHGSWVFLGELLLNIDLEYDTQMIEDHCGSCTLCIEACPTQALTEPYVLDSNKCISYATIELREPNIPEAIAENLDGWLYGCDVCQDVCPWNRFAEPSPEEAFQPREHNVNADLHEVLALTPAAYAERFRHSAIKRAKLSGLQRNAKHLIQSQSSPESEDSITKGAKFVRK